MKILEKEKEEKKKIYREGTERNGRTDKKQKCKKLCIVRGDKKKKTNETIQRENCKWKTRLQKDE